MTTYALVPGAACSSRSRCSSAPAVAAARGRGRRSARAADARPVPRGHDARPRRGHTVDPRASDLPDRRADRRRVMPRPVIGQLLARVRSAPTTACASPCSALAIVAVARLRRSGLGRVLLAVRDNELAASAMGLSPTRVKLFAFAVVGRTRGTRRRPAGRARPAVHDRPVRRDRVPAGRRRRRRRRSRVDHRCGARRAARRRPAGVLPEQRAGRVCSPAASACSILLLYFPGGLVQILYSGRDAVLAFVASASPTAATAPAPKPARAADRRFRPVRPRRARRSPPCCAPKRVRALRRAGRCSMTCRSRSAGARSSGSSGRTARASRR